MAAGKEARPPSSAGYRPAPKLLERLVRREPRPRGGELHYVPVGVAQVQRLEVGPVHHVGAGDAARAKVAMPAGEFLLGLDRQGEVVCRAAPDRALVELGVL